MKFEECKDVNDIPHILYHHIKNQLPPTIQLLYMDMNIEYSDHVSNRYASPIGKRVNFLNNKLQYFSGYIGDIRVKFSTNLVISFPSYFKDIPIYPHSTKNNRNKPPTSLKQPSWQYWKIKLFLDDWKQIKLRHALLDEPFPEQILGEFNEYGEFRLKQ